MVDVGLAELEVVVFDAENVIKGAGYVGCGDVAVFVDVAEEQLYFFVAEVVDFKLVVDMLGSPLEPGLGLGREAGVVASAPDGGVVVEGLFGVVVVVVAILQKLGELADKANSPELDVEISTVLKEITAAFLLPGKG